MSFRSAIQAFITPFNETETELGVVNWNTGKFFVWGQYDSVESLIRFNVFSGQAEAHAPATDYVGTFPPYAFGSGFSGQLYCNNTNDNCGGLQEIDQNTLAFIEQWGTPNSVQQWANPPDNTIPANVTAPQAMCACGLPNYDLLVTMSHVSGNKLAGFYGPAWYGGVSPPTTGLYYNYNISPNDNPTAVPFQGIPGSGVCYVVGSPVNGSDTQALTLFKIVGTTSSFEISTLGSIAPTDIDSGWSQIYFAGGFTDQTDGNIILKLKGQSGASNPSYILKVAPGAPGTPLWQVKVNVVDSDGGLFSGQTSVKTGTFCHYSEEEGLFQINTISGDYTMIPYDGAYQGVLGSVQAYNDTYGTMIFNATYDEVPGDSPVPINGTPDSFEGWAIMYVDEATPPTGGCVTFNRVWGNWNL